MLGSWWVGKGLKDFSLDQLVRVAQKDNQWLAQLLAYVGLEQREERKG